MEGYISTEVETKMMRDIVAKAMGLPDHGITVGGGRHGIGITLYYSDVLQHPTNGSWVMPCDEAVKNIPNNSQQFSLLTQREQDFLVGCLSNLHEITTDWYDFSDLPVTT